jgi:hypothetical protein
MTLTPAFGVRSLSAGRWAKEMSLEVQVYRPMPSRSCRFCLSLQGGSVFADFEVDEGGLAFLRRISFDGYGCCDGDFKKMNAEDSRLLIESVERGSVDGPVIPELLRRYLGENTDAIWSDALASHELL